LIAWAVDAGHYDWLGGPAFVPGRVLHNPRRQRLGVQRLSGPAFVPGRVLYNTRRQRLGVQRFGSPAFVPGRVLHNPRRQRLRIERYGPGMVRREDTAKTSIHAELYDQGEGESSDLHCGVTFLWDKSKQVGLILARLTGYPLD
jgi:hypothetical protein